MTTDDETMSREVLLARTFVELADTLGADFDVDELLSRLVDRCVLVLGVDGAGLMLVTPAGELRLATSSSGAIRTMELFELEAKEGPSVDCCLTGEPVMNRNLGDLYARWPNFAPIAVDAGLRSVHALPMRRLGQVIGAVNLYWPEDGALRDGDVLIGQALADMATIAMLQHRAATESKVLNDQLSYALNSRILIEQAKGVLAERAGIDMAQAFGRLRKHARNHNLRLSDLAQQVIDRTLDTSALDSPGR